MAFRNGCFASVWQITPGESGKYADVKISTSRKKPNTNPPQYESDFLGKVRFIGKAFEDIMKYPQEPVAEHKAIARLRLDEVSATVTPFKKQSGETMYYTGFQCYAFTPADQATAPAPATTTVVENIPEGIDEELPFA